MIAISITDVHPDPLGPDRIRNKNIKLNQEWIEIKNTGTEAFKLKDRLLIDWTETNKKRHKKVFSPQDPDFALPVDKKLRIFTGKRDDPDDPVPEVPEGVWTYTLCYGAYIWNNTGDIAEIYASEADFDAGKAPLARKKF